MEYASHGFSAKTDRPTVWRWVLTCILLTAGLLSFQARSAHIPAQKGWVSDYASMMSKSERGALSDKLQALRDRKGSQLVVVTVGNLQGETIEAFTLQLAESWKIGRGEIDDGVILLIAKSERKIRIEVGYGLEGAVTDAYAKRIIEDYITPNFKSGKYYQGINEGVDALISLIDGEELPPPTYKDKGFAPESIFYIIAFAVGILLAAFDKWKHWIIAVAIGVAIAWLVLSLMYGIQFGVIALIINLIGRAKGGGGGTWTGGGWSGGGWSGGSSGGGFSGGGWSGGGGGFGGGGASGGW